ncbi:protein containg ParB-like nuclease domain [Longilinea arvoryzae]|uniref:Protein containg ParB-like nuclease domain n=1 Tax=Longilinea arvoryzae TaxID=360412 RepID=A0A0S7BE88_9CHLR|nr:hypothetical protein [Longilinea arvoryzae]GAP13837.1 protein containg ParB-like nuclease domain [Longilinea arvoryzae]
MFTPMMGPAIGRSYNRPADEARRQFNAALQRGNLFTALNGLLGRRQGLNSLPSFAEFRREYSRGLVTVPIRKIIGSENRSRDYDRFFNPLNETTRERWIRVAVSIFKGRPLPPITLIEVDGFYYLRDGHHRVSVARMNGQLEIEALVTVWER